MSETFPELPPEIYSLRKEVGQLRFVLILLMLVGLLLLTLMNLAAVASVPRFERIFEEMLGDVQRLPTLAKAFIFYSRIGGGLVPYAVVLTVPGLTALGLLFGSRTRTMPLLCIAVMAFLVVHFVVLYVAMFTPLMTIAQGVGERTN
jgi:hypothetical protein